MSEALDAGSLGGRPAWGGVAAVALGTFVMVTTEFLPIGMLSAMSRDLRVSEGTAGSMVTLPGLVAAIAAPIVTLAAGNVDRKLLLVALSSLILLSNVAVAFSPSFAIVLAGRMMLGASVGGFWTFAAAVGRRLVPAAQGGRATALILAGISVGTVVGVPIGTTLGSLVGWRWAFGGVAALALLAAIGQWALLPSLPSRNAISLRDVGSLCLVPRLAVGFAATALVAGGHFAAYTYLEPFLGQVAGLTTGVGLSAALAAYGAAGVLGNFAGERATARNLLHAFVCSSVALAGAILLVIALASSMCAVVVALLLWGAAFGAVPVAVQAWTYEAAPERFEAASALMVSVFQIAIALGAFAGGRLVDHLGLRSAFGLGAVLSALSALVIYSASRVAPLRESGNDAVAQSAPPRPGESVS